MDVGDYRHEIAVTLWKISELFASDPFKGEILSLRETITERLYREFKQNDKLSMPHLTMIENLCDIKRHSTSDFVQLAAVKVVEEVCTKIYEDGGKNV
ncbi:MAG: hypothetical protein IJK26_09985 [Clostridia bacterium]|nr:hypothetical protein [Clostridia bacterium]